MKATQKSPQVEKFLSAKFGFDRVETIRTNCCVPAPIGCGEPAEYFRDELSQREYTISGLCQDCQDSFFGQ